MKRGRSAIAVTGLRKSFGDRVVLDGVDLEVEEGAIFALLGPHGAGKTTLVRILSTLADPDAGTVRIAGHDPAADPDAGTVRIAGHDPAADPDAGTMRIAGHDPAADPDAVRAALGLTGGFPRVVLLDEPTAGLDPRSRHTMWRLIRWLAAGGVTVLLTTQHLEEAERLADRIGVLDRGRLVAEGTADELKRLVGGGHIRLHFGDPGELEAAAGALGAGERDADGLTLRIDSDGSLHALWALLNRLDGDAIAVEALSVHTPDLDDVFLALTGG